MAALGFSFRGLCIAHMPNALLASFNCGQAEACAWGGGGGVKGLGASNRRLPGAAGSFLFVWLGPCVVPGRYAPLGCLTALPLESGLGPCPVLGVCSIARQFTGPD